MNDFIKQIRTAVGATFLFAILLCGVYPFTVWLLAQGIFPDKANGSLVVERGQVIGSALLAQQSSDPRYFHPRPSAAGNGYDAMSSGGSNLGPISKKLIDAVQERVYTYRAENNLGLDVPLPADAVTASGSGLDPHISLRNALIQAERVARTRGMSREGMNKRLEAFIEGRTFGLFGEPRVNVLKLNLALDGRLGG